MFSVVFFSFWSLWPERLYSGLQAYIGFYYWLLFKGFLSTVHFSPRCHSQYKRSTLHTRGVLFSTQLHLLSHIWTIRTSIFRKMNPSSKGLSSHKKFLCIQMRTWLEVYYSLLQNHCGYQFLTNYIKKGYPESSVMAWNFYILLFII